MINKTLQILNIKDQLVLLKQQKLHYVITKTRLNNCRKYYVQILSAVLVARKKKTLHKF